jgi:hypothetical protein
MDIERKKNLYNNFFSRMHANKVDIQFPVSLTRNVNMKYYQLKIEKNNYGTKIKFWNFIIYRSKNII